MKTNVCKCCHHDVHNGLPVLRSKQCLHEQVMLASHYCCCSGSQIGCTKHPHASITCPCRRHIVSTQVVHAKQQAWHSAKVLFHDFKEWQQLINHGVMSRTNCCCYGVQVGTIPLCRLGPQRASLLGMAGDQERGNTGGCTSWEPGEPSRARHLPWSCWICLCSSDCLNRVSV